jgi:hypothetical protein
MRIIDRPTLKRFDLLLGSVVLSFLLLVAVIGSFIWLEL